MPSQRYVELMGKALIVAEKPSVGRDLAAALGYQFSRSKDGTHLESDRVVISWAVGHLVRLADPDEYQPEWKQWRMEHLPMTPAPFKIKPAPKTRKQLTALKQLMSRDDVNLIVNACDAGREGELIFRYVAQYARCHKPIKRLWLASLTKEAIVKGLQSMRDGAEYDTLADAARSRAEADWMVGMNGTRAATIVLRPAIGGTASIGRVQTPTLALLVHREMEIRNFKPEDFWVVEADFATTADAGARRYRGSYRDGHRFTSAAVAEQVAAAVRVQAGTVAKVERQQVAERAPQLYDLTSLQRDASGAFGWTAAQTLQVAQRLYETHKVVTYPRTDSRWLTTDMAAGLPALLGKVGRVARYAPHAQRIAAKELPLGQVVNDAKVTDHHAIIPTGASPQGLAGEDAQLFDMVTRRLLAALSDASIVQRTRVETVVGEHPFISKGRVIAEAGWRAVYDDVSWVRSEEQILPDLAEGESVDTAEVETIAKQTQPPKRYTDAGLLGAMETAGKLVDDDEAREAMKECGLGTPATRAAIIERLIKVGYVGRQRKALVPTEKGVRLIELLGEHPLTSPQLTGDWERALGRMARGELQRSQFMAAMVAFCGQLVDGMRELEATVAALPPEQRAAPEPRRGGSASSAPAEPVGECPGCGKPVVESKKSYSCWTREDPGCGLAIWKTTAGRKLPKKAVKELLTAGRTSEKIGGFKSRAGNVFDAHLRLEQVDGRLKVSFDFGD